MDLYLRLLYELPAVLGGTTMLAYLSPVKFDVRFSPLLMFVVGLLVQLLPPVVGIALAMALAAAWLQFVLGISLTEHEPLKVQVKLPKLPRQVPIRQFVTRAYPDPAAEPEDPNEIVIEEDEVPSHEPPEGTTVVPKYVPSL